MRLEGIVNKGWGSENIWVTNDLYCSKFLRFNTDSKFSMHFHAKKHESWFVISGKFNLYYIDTKTASILVQELNANDSITIEPLLPHQLHCIEAGVILEVSTPDSVEDNYRIVPGDSQNENSNS